ncbi:MAG: histidine kinase [Actinomycetota bacterium]|nr:histidine kinase [Actinomycetota bacterium]
MQPLAVISVLLAVAWALAGIVVLRGNAERSDTPLALICALLAGAHAVAAASARLAPLVIGAWLLYVLALPGGRLATLPRRALAALGGAAAIGWAAVSVADGSTADTAAFVSAALAVCAAGAVATGLRFRRAVAEERRSLQWLAAASVLTTAFVAVCGALHLMTDAPTPLGVWLASALLVIPFGQVLASLVPGSRAAVAALVESIAAAGVAAVVAVVYLVIVVGINGAPRGHERSVLLESLVAALIVAMLAVPVRHRLIRGADTLVGGREPSSDEVVTAFGARMSRAVPMDELMLQLVESLRATMARGGAEIWTGTQGNLVRAVSMPDRGGGRLQLAERERVVVGRARIGGPGWTAVWLPELFASEETRGDHRVVPIAHLGELLGLVVVRRAAGAAPFSDDDERSLVEVARQLGLALHNVRLDSALQASLAELAERNEELQASRLRIVTAADSSRRAIERNLHDGAQQHLVALAVKLGLARQIAEDGETETVLALLEDLRGDVQVTIGELRELAHGIYPPLLRDRGLGEALRTASLRATLPCTVDVELSARYPEEVETAAYFCCLEAMQNAGKYAGEGATVTVRVHSDDDALHFELSDDGAGFDTDTTPLGHGFMNMRDRLGALNGRLTVESTPGVGTTVRASIPARPIEAAGSRSDQPTPAGSRM